MSDIEEVVELEVVNPLVEEGARPPVAFTIIGQRDGAEARERFLCMAEPPWGAIDELMKPRVNIARYIRLVMVEEDEPRWDKLIQDKRFNVQPEAVRSAYYKLVAHYSDRPTPAPGDSGPGRNDSDEPSQDAGDSPDSPPSEASE